MKLGMTLYLQDSPKAVDLYMEAFNLTLDGGYAMHPDGTFMHAPLCRNGQELFAVSEAPTGELTKAVLQTAASHISPIASHGIDFDSEEALEKAYETLTDGGIVIRPLGKLPWDSLSAEIVDRFGVCWYLVKW